MKRYEHKHPPLPPEWMPPWVATLIEWASPIVGWELGGYFIKLLGLTCVMCLVCCNDHSTHVKCMNPDGTSLIDAEVTHAVSDKGVTWVYLSDHSRFTTTASCVITYGAPK